jgi:lysozyme
MLKGVDIYAGDGAVEWLKLAQAGMSFVFIRGAYGTVPDKAVAANVAGARAAGLKVGLYHFFRARLDPARQIAAMRQVIKAVGVGPGDLPPALDVEDNPAHDGAWNAADNPAYIAACRHWVHLVREQVGKHPVIYTRAGFWAQLGNPAGFSDSPLWVASYRDEAPRMPAGWDVPYTFWQYSDSATVPGVAGRVDANYFNGDAAALQLQLL